MFRLAGIEHGGHLHWDWKYQKKEFNPSNTTESLVRKKLVDPHALVRNFPIAYLAMKNRARASVF